MTRPTDPGEPAEGLRRIDGERHARLGPVGAAPPRARVTVSLVTFNGRRWIDACLASVLDQTYPWVELLLVDNGSTDGTAEHLQRFARAHPESELVLLPRNVGYSGGHNRALAMSTGEYVCLLNQDAVLDPAFLAESVDGLQQAPAAGSLQGRVLRLAPGLARTSVVDTTGLVMSRSRRVVSRRRGTADSTGPFEPSALLGADGPCPVYRRAALEEVAYRTLRGVEYLDDDFFAYKEDVDLAWRLRAAGWDTLYRPSAVAWHARSAAEPASGSVLAWLRQRRAMPAWLRRTAWRNHRLMIVKNDSPSAFFRDLLPIAWHELRAAALLIVVNPVDLIAVAGFVRLIPRMLAKRRSMRRQIARSRSRKDSVRGVAASNGAASRSTTVGALQAG